MHYYYSLWLEFELEGNQHFSQSGLSTEFFCLGRAGTLIYRSRPRILATLEIQPAILKS